MRIEPIGRPTREQFGGLYALLLVATTDVAHLPRSVGGLIPHPLDLKEGGELAAIYFTPDTARVTQRTEQTGHGPRYTTQVRANLPDDDVVIVSWIMRHTMRNMLAVAVNYQRRARLIGTLDYPARLVAAFDSQTSPRQGRGFSLDLRAVSTEPAPIILGVDMVELPDRKVFSDGFSYGFLRT